MVGVSLLIGIMLDVVTVVPKRGVLTGGVFIDFQSSCLFLISGALFAMWSVVCVLQSSAKCCPGIVLGGGSNALLRISTLHVVCMGHLW